MKKGEVIKPKGKLDEPTKSRIAAGQTQAEAAALVEVSISSWRAWEQGVTDIPAPILKLYRHLAGVERIPFRSA